jgi:deoxyribonuclease-4
MKAIARGVGLQLPLGASVTALAETALRLELPFFQCFFLEQKTGKPFVLERDDREQFLRLRDEHFGPLFAHGSYPINLADGTCKEHPRLDRELFIAERLGFTHLVLHPGSYVHGSSKEGGIESLARALNKLSKRQLPLTIVLENVAHGKRAIGGDLSDFKAILERIDKPDTVSFCIDTAHAHSFGYELTSPESHESFLSEIERTVGLERVALLHLNDTRREKGEQVDQHCILGGGKLGSLTLKVVCQDVRLAQIPIVLEMSGVSEKDEVALVKQVVEWSVVTSKKER